MTSRLMILAALTALIASASAELKRVVNVSKEEAHGWSKPVSVEITFATGSELAERNVAGVEKSKTYGMLWFTKENVALIEIEPPKGAAIAGFDLAAYLCLFVPTSSVFGNQVNAANGTKVRYKIEAKWPGDAERSRLARQVESAAIKSDDRLVAAEMKMILGDKAGAIRHLRIAMRNFQRQSNLLKAAQIGTLVPAGIGMSEADSR